jgi:hypothetical protein
MAAVSPIADSVPRAMPHLSIAGAADALELFRSVLGANERTREEPM